MSNSDDPNVSRPSLAAEGGYPNGHLLVDTRWLAEHLDDPALRFVDLRPKEDYQKGHIRNAVHTALDLFRTTIDGVPGMVVPTDTLERSLGELGIANDTTVVAYDAGTGLDAARFLWTLEYYGHGDARILSGGVALWQREDRQFVLETPPIVPCAYHAAAQPDRLATAQQLLALLCDSGTAIVDTRTPQEYTGQVAQLATGPQLPIKRLGHIPGAANLEWVNNLAADRTGRFKPAAELLAMYEAAGITRDKQVITYCRTGHRAAHSYLALRLLGYPRVRLYDGSWAEWNTRPELPAERECGE